MLAPGIFRQFFLIFLPLLFFAQLNVAANAEGSRSSSSSPPGTINRDQAVVGTKVIIKVAGKELPGTLADNPTAREFASLLPLHIVMDDLFGREKAGPLPRAISTRGPRSDVYDLGEIGYWSPGHDVAIYYRQDGDRIPSPGIINIGRVDSGIETFNVPGSLDVIIERAP
jgi:hypothetical protein